MFFLEKKTDNKAIERLFSGLPAESFVGCCWSCDVYDQKSIFSLYFSGKILPFLNFFRSRSGDSSHSRRFASAVFPKLVLGGPMYFLMWIGCFWTFCNFFNTWEFIEIIFLSRSREKWSKLQSTCSEKQSEEAFTSEKMQKRKAG